MIVDEEQEIGPQGMSLQFVWRSQTKATKRASR